MKKTLLAILSTLAAAGASAEATGKAPPEWGGRVNWHAWARTTSIPALHSAACLTDGDTDTAAQFTIGGEAGADLKIAFPKPVEVTGLRFAQKRPAASHVQLWADPDGSGAYTNLVADRKDEKPVVDEWIDIPVGMTVAGLRLSFLAGDVGYRSVFPKLAELEIYGKGGGAPLPEPRAGESVATLGVKPLPRLDGKPLTDIRVCTDWWNWGMQQWEDANAKLKEENGKLAAGETPKPEIALKDWGPYKGTVGQLKELGVTSVRMFAESEACGANGGFSSFPLKGLPKKQQHDWLAPLAKQLHADGYPVYYFSHAWRAPIQKIGAQPPSPWLRWDYPYMASDALVGINEHYTNWYPCVLSDRDFRDKWTDLLRGALKAGADGVYLCPDEYFYKGHNLSRCKCASCRKAFQARFGYDALPVLTPPKQAQNAQGQVAMLQPADTEQFRKYKVFEYEQLANLFHGVGADLRREFPKAKLVMNENQGSIGNSNGRLEHTVANDLFGNGPEYDEKQVYGGSTMCVDANLKHLVFAKHFEAACGGTDRLLSSAGWGPANLRTPTEQYNSVLPEVFVGAKALEIYRLNYIFMGGASSVWKKTLKMVRLLDAWGLRDSTMPADVGLVYSRASEDWWQVKVGSQLDPSARSAATDFHLHLADETINKVAAGADTPERTRLLSNERFRGWGAQNAVESLVAANGFPYRVLYAERPDNMRDLARFKVLVLPFAYSLSREAADAIRAAHAAGTKLVIFEHLAPTDEYGTPYGEPLLKDLVGQEGVTFVEASASDTAADLRKLREYADLVAKANADSGYSFHAPANRPVTYLVRELNGGKGWLLYLCNTAARAENAWGGVNAATVSIGLPAEKGTYRMETFSSDTCDVSENAIGDKTAIPGESLRNFRIYLDPQEVKIIRFSRQ